MGRTVLLWTGRLTDTQSPSQASKGMMNNVTGGAGGAYLLLPEATFVIGLELMASGELPFFAIRQAQAQAARHARLMTE